VAHDWITMSEQAPPVDTLHAPHEPVVPAPTSLWMWVTVLLGPVTWFAHFMTVYLTAEAVCTPILIGARSPSDQPWSASTFDGFVLAATVVGVVICTVDAFIAGRRARGSGGQGMWWIGLALALGSAVAIVAVGIPALVVEPCAA
jgi:hypothetical protein